MALSYLVPEPLLTISPNLAVKIGLNETIFVQQLQFWLSRKAGICDEYGCRWIYNSVRQWQQQFPFWSESTIKRTIRSVEEKGVVRSRTMGDAFNRTKAYTINYERIEEISQVIVHEQRCASIESVQRRFLSPPNASPHSDDASSPLPS